jgi:hypothetical protein
MHKWVPRHRRFGRLTAVTVTSSRGHYAREGPA